MLWDIGPGAVEKINGNYGVIGNVKHVFISHWHIDHQADLVVLCTLRQIVEVTRRRENLTIYYPFNSNIASLKQYILTNLGELKYKLTWVPLQPGDVIEISNSWKVKAFSVTHGKAPAMGFTLLQSRSRLNSLGLSLGNKIADVMRSASQSDKEKYTEHYDFKAIVYSGDAYTMPLIEAKDAQVLVHDTTFLTRDVIRTNTHAMIDDVLSFANKANVKTLILSHISPRYSHNEQLNSVCGVKTPYKLQYVPTYKELNLDLT